MLRPSPNLLLYYFGLGGLLSGFLLCFISVHQYYIIMKLSVDQSLTPDPWVWLPVGIPMGIPRGHLCGPAPMLDLRNKSGVQSMSK